MKFKGTKGKWNVFPIHNKQHGHTWFKVSSSETEDYSDAESVCNIITRNGERAESNSKLIAAAPELLESLQVVLDEMDILDSIYFEEEINLAKQAINKALNNKQ